MFYETGCYGRIALAPLPRAVEDRLNALPGEWLEFDPVSATIVVRHAQPSSSPCLPTIASELLRFLSEIPVEIQANIEGGELMVHTEGKGQLVRLRVEPGGALNIAWAHPDYNRAEPRLWSGREPLVPAAVQRLNGCVSFDSAGPDAAAREIEELADNFEGLYPEGEFAVTADAAQGKVQIAVRDLNLDVALLLARLQKLATPGSLEGRIEVSSFAALAPEQNARFLFEQGQVWVQRPVLWPDAPLPKAEAAAR